MVSCCSVSQLIGGSVSGSVNDSLLVGWSEVLGGLVSWKVCHLLGRSVGQLVDQSVS